MNEDFIIHFLHRRMKQMSVAAYVFEPLFFDAIKTGEKFAVQNEWWYLVGLPQNVKIVSDTAYYNSLGTVIEALNVPEFTGTISITAVDEKVPLHFVRVIIQK